MAGVSRGDLRPGDFLLPLVGAAIGTIVETYGIRLRDMWVVDERWPYTRIS